MSVASRAKSAVKGAVKDAAFEALHPRARAGLPNAGEFVEVEDRIIAAGGRLDRARGVWIVPKSARETIDQILDEINFHAVTIPDGFHMARPGERSALNVPAPWTSVFVADDLNRKGQIAFGYDASGKRQPIMPKAYSESNAGKKYARVRALYPKLPAIRERLRQDAAHDDTALALLLMERFGVRPGARGKRQANKEGESYGAQTMLVKHVNVSGNKVRLRFPGKSGKLYDQTIEDAELARFMKQRMKGRDGDEVFLQYTGDLRLRTMFKELTGDPESKPYDLRTYLGTSLAIRHLETMQVPRTQAEYKRFQREVSEAVSDKLNNTPKEALKSYIDPVVWDVWPDKDSLPSAKTRISRVGEQPKLRGKAMNARRANEIARAQSADRSDVEEKVVQGFRNNPQHIQHALMYSPLGYSLDEPGKALGGGSNPRTEFRPGRGPTAGSQAAMTSEAQVLAAAKYVPHLDKAFDKVAPLEEDLEVGATIPLDKLPQAPALAGALEQESVASLRQRARSRGLSDTGKKADLVKRLRADIDKRTTTRQMSAERGLERMSKSELALMAERRGLLDTGAEVPSGRPWEEWRPARLTRKRTRAGSRRGKDVDVYRGGTKVVDLEGNSGKVIAIDAEGAFPSVTVRFDDGEIAEMKPSELQEMVGGGGAPQLSKNDLIEMLREDVLETAAMTQATRGELDHLIGHEHLDRRFPITTTNLKRTVAKGEDTIETRILVPKGERVLVLSGGNFVLPRNRRFVVTGVDRSVDPPRLIMELKPAKTRRRR